MRVKFPSWLGWTRRFLREDAGIVYITVGSVASTVLGALFWLILASQLEVTHYGQLNHAIAVASIAAGVGSLGLATTLTTYVAKGDEDVVSEAYSLTLLAGLLCAGLLTFYQWGVGLLAAVTIVYGMTMAEVLGRRRYREYACVSIGQRVVQILLALLLYVPLGVDGLLLGYALSYLVVSYRYARSLRRFSFRITHLREKRRFIVHSYGMSLLSSLATLDRVIVGTLFGYYTLGLYQLGFQFFMFLAVIPGSLYKYLLPEASSGADRRGVKRVALVLSVIASLSLVVCSPFIIERFFPKFVDATQVVQVMSLAVIPATIAATFRATLLGNEQSKVVFASGAIYLVALLGGLPVMGNLTGLLGLGVTVVVAKAVQAIYLKYGS